MVMMVMIVVMVVMVVVVAMVTVMVNIMAMLADLVHGAGQQPAIRHSPLQGRQGEGECDG
jgi:hypothetical protein